MKFVWLGALCVLLFAGNGMAIDEKTMSEAMALREQGEFAKATRLLQTHMEETSATLSHEDKRTIEFEIERMRRIRQDYTTTRDNLLEQLRRRLTKIDDEEFDKYEQDGFLDTLVIDGQKFYVNASASNLILRVPDLRARRKDSKPGTSDRKLYAQMQRAKEAQKTSKDHLVCPQDFHVTYSLIVKANAAPEGKTVRCWLPFARAIPSQSDMYILSSEPADYVVSPPLADHRTVYFERTAKKDEPTTFSLEFIYRCWTRVSKVDPEAVLPYRKDSPEYQFYTAQRKPHIDFENEELKKLSSEIVNGETNPYKIARRIYDWIGENVIYQYAREYSTLDNISFYTASRRAGDCGQHGMLFITLCRMNGVPARWATGWESFDTRGNNMHDWCEFYVEPYGWLASDPDMGVNVLRYSDDQLTTGQAAELADWLFDNMDHYRLTVNGDYGMPLVPEKNDFRSETVDFQRGEVEYDNHNLYFDQWKWTMRIQPISVSEAAAFHARFLPPEVRLPDPPPPKAPPVSDTPTTPTVAVTAAGTENTSETAKPATMTPVMKEEVSTATVTAATQPAVAAALTTATQTSETSSTITDAATTASTN